MLLTGAVPWEHSDRPLLTLSLAVALPGRSCRGASGSAGGWRSRQPSRRRPHRRGVHRRRCAGRAHAAGLDAELPADLRAALVRLRQRRPSPRTRLPGCCWPATSRTGSWPAGTAGGRGRRRRDRLRHRDLRGLAVDGQRLRRRGRPDPAVLWLLLVLSGSPGDLAAADRHRRLGACSRSALISVLDWARGPDRRSHLGNFVQRIIDGDALDVVARKAVASVETILSPLGIVAADHRHRRLDAGLPLRGAAGLGRVQHRRARA